MQTKEEKVDQLPRSDGSHPKPKVLVIRRQFQVPVARLFAAFVTAEALKACDWLDRLTAGNRRTQSLGRGRRRTEGTQTSQQSRLFICRFMT